MRFVSAILALAVMAPLVARAGSVSPAGLYRNAEGVALFVGIEHYLPGPAENEAFDPRTRQLTSSTAGATLVSPITEQRRSLRTHNGMLGVSIYYTGSGKRPTVILIHGNDPETREMGFLIPYFVCNGVNVISYDQRGTGDSTGNWFLSGPQQRAVDVEAVFDSYADDSHVDGKRFGLWGVSNGGWTAPIVANARPVAFLLLKSPPAEPVADNIRYEAEQRLRHDGYDSAAIQQAMDMWSAMFAALDGSGSWTAAAAKYNDAAPEKWFMDSAMPPHLSFPVPAPMIDGFRNAVSFVPAATLARLRTPTIAFFGQLDRNVDVAHASLAFRAAFVRTGGDFTERIFPDSGHSLLVSRTGFSGEAIKPARYSAGYPEGMLDWLESRNFLTADETKQRR
ncbi:MAG: alpha/beta hydrolase [Candidatus Eremiobacteraeota bacterium]|nr:alpha/beta hydrolase [Candidatus Eremiobacteraeota bacterium]